MSTTGGGNGNDKNMVRVVFLIISLTKELFQTCLWTWSSHSCAPCFPCRRSLDGGCMGREGAWEGETGGDGGKQLSEQKGRVSGTVRKKLVDSFYCWWMGNLHTSVLLVVLWSTNLNST